jgi:endonuclease/exonuclease/phosphatase family metal-dependent hydrolase
MMLETSTLLLAPRLTLHEKVALPSRDLTLVSYNVHFGKKTASLRDIFSSEPNLAAADIILFQEIEHHMEEVIPRAERIAESLGYHCLYAPGEPKKRNGTHGLAILSRLPILDYEVMPLSRYKLLFRPRARIALRATLKAGDKTLHVCNIHLDLPINIKERIEQIKPVIEQLKTSEADAVVFAGDLNTSPVRWLSHGIPLFYSDQRRKVKSFLQENNFQASCEDGQYTFEAGLLRTRLDGIYTKGVSVLDYGIERQVDISDHKPLWVKFKI